MPPRIRFCTDAIPVCPLLAVGRPSRHSRTHRSLCFAAGSSRTFRPRKSGLPSGRGTLIISSMSPAAEEKGERAQERDEVVGVGLGSAHTKEHAKTSRETRAVGALADSRDVVRDERLQARLDGQLGRFEAACSAVRESERQTCQRRVKAVLSSRGQRLRICDDQRSAAA